MITVRLNRQEQALILRKVNGACGNNTKEALVYAEIYDKIFFASEEDKAKSAIKKAAKKLK